jgi:formimidoylglutamate deiminase
LGQLEALRDRGIRVGVAPHSVRACPPSWLEELGNYAVRESLPLHVHADEQPREIEECLAEAGVRPIELLAECGCLGPHTTVVHATHAEGPELDLIADAGARVCICPTTEANLGDGIDPFEELRELEGIARRRTGRRNVVSPDALLSFGADEGAASLGLEAWPEIEVDLGHASLRGVDEADVLPALVFGCSADVVVGSAA